MEKYINNSIDIGAIETASKDEEQMVFRILMAKGWEEEIKSTLFGLAPPPGLEPRAQL